MNKKTFKGKWRQMRGAIKEEWGQLTDDEIQSLQGRADRLLGLLEERYGYTRQKAEEEIGRFLKKYGYRRPSRRQQMMTWAMRLIRRRPIWSMAVVVFAAAGAGILYMRWIQATSVDAGSGSTPASSPRRPDVWSTDDIDRPLPPPGVEF